VSLQIVWFKKDLRIEDNIALSSAFSSGKPVLLLYILEPELWCQPDMSYRHYIFLQECLYQLENELSKLGHSLTIKVGEAIAILDNLANEFSVESIWSHQETWNNWTYMRDKKVRLWARQRGIKWHEPVQNGVIRRLKQRGGWAARWYQIMKQPLAPPIKAHPSMRVESPRLPPPAALGLGPDGCVYNQLGGREEGLRLLNSFLYSRGEGYTKEMSSPVSAYESCSRLSPHLAFGTISMREVFQATQRREQELASAESAQRGKWPSAIRSFSGRLRWHCHFIQKLEDEPRLEFENLHHAYNGLRENSFNTDYFEAWKAGMTGYPMIDACMRALRATGWLNFRMRAMLMSFASYHLWLHWRQPALYLAKLFTDYEPGIHYSQVQMQSGTTGINAIRIYNPIKQGIDHDPAGVFIRRWLPELSDLPGDKIHTPWQMPSLVKNYPGPIVEEKSARREAAAQVYALRKTKEHGEESNAIVLKHASRKKVSRKRSYRKAEETKQLKIPLFDEP